MRDAITGSFDLACPKIWNVYATPLDKIPVYSKGIALFIIFPTSGDSKISIGTEEMTPHTKNCIQLKSTPFTLGENLSTVSMWNALQKAHSNM